MLTKNEADVVAYSIREAMKWADFVYVYDNGSTDGTWEVVQSLQSERVIAWKQHHKSFCEGLRADVFNEFSHRAKEGDWWFKLDADDFYAPELKQQLAQIPKGYDMVWTITLDFQITREDLKTIDFASPIETVLHHLRYYQLAFSEPHGFRHRKRLLWSPEKSWPTHAGVVASFRPLTKHYPHRSPQQIQTRLDIRRAARAQGFIGWDHASQVSWAEKIADRARCQFDDGSGHYPVDETRIPRHIEPPARRLLKLLMHRTGVWP
jgi:glycosyltransferase involved in cell wall biosynthesis